MSIKDLIRLGRHEAAPRAATKPAPAHAIESGYAADRCRFSLTCACGASHDTPFIDEALEWRELHLRLAPLADRLPS